MHLESPAYSSGRAAMSINDGEIAMPEALLDSALRRIEKSASNALRPFDRYGGVVPELEWRPLSKSEDGNQEIYLIRFKPGASSVPHEHTGIEEFLVLEGDLTDCDGVVFRAGDFVSYAPGSRHFSSSKNGCTLLVSLRGGNNRPVERD